MVNPYLQAQRLAEEMRAINLLNFENPIKDKCQPPTGYTLTGNKVEDSLISFGRWFLFCQRCRHGGHSGCISSWFEHHRKRAEKAEVLRLHLFVLCHFIMTCTISGVLCFGRRPTTTVNSDNLWGQWLQL